MSLRFDDHRELMYKRVQNDQGQRIGVGCGGDEGVKVKVMGG